MLKRYDLSRFKKVYPLLREKPNLRELSDEITSQIDVEVEVLSFENAHTGSYTFKKTYQNKYA